MLIRSTPIHQRILEFGLLFCFLTLTVIVYWPALSGPFLLDDLVNIPQTRITSLSAEQLWHVASGNDSGLFGRPISVLTFALNYYLGGDWTYGFKLTNLSLHLVNGFLLYLLVVKLLSAVQLRCSENFPFNAKYFALVVTGIWLIHPLQVSGVMYVVQRMNMLSMFFTLLALLVFSQCRMSQLSRSSPTPLIKLLLPGLLTLTLTLFACLSKENGVLTIAYLVWIEMIIFRFQTRADYLSKRYFRSLICVGFVGLILGSTYFYWNTETLLAGYAIRDFSLIERLVTQASVVIFYIRQIVLPDVGIMSLYIDDFGVVRSLNVRAVVSIAVIGIFGVACILLRNRHPIVSLGLGLYLLSHMLESTILPLEMVFEHRNYFGLWGIALAVSYIFAKLFFRFRAHYRYVLAGLCIMFLSAQTLSRSIVWGDEFLHSAFAAESRPTSPRSQGAFATSLARANQFEAAENVLAIALDRGMDPAFTALRIILIKGMRNLVQEADIQRAVTALSEQPVMVRHGTTLVDIYTNFVSNRFDRPNLNDMLDLYQAIADNTDQRLKTPDRGRVQGMYAKLLLQDAQIGKSHQRIIQAFDFDPNKAEIEFAAGARSELSKTLKYARNHKSRFTRNQSSRMQAIMDRLDVAEVDSYVDELR